FWPVTSDETTEPRPRKARKPVRRRKATPTVPSVTVFTSSVDKTVRRFTPPSPTGRRRLNYAARSVTSIFALLILDPCSGFNWGFLNISLKRRVMPSTTNKRPRRNRKAANDKSNKEKKKRSGNINQISMQLRCRSEEGIELRHYQ